MICLIKAWMAVDDTDPPCSDPSWLLKKYLNSKIPRGHERYFWVVTLEIVDSCMPTASAISLSTKGRIPSAPIAKNFCCLATISFATLRIVSSLWIMFFTNQLASSIFCFKAPVASSLPLSFRMRAYSLFKLSFGLAFWLALTTHCPCDCLTTTSGKIHWSTSRSNSAPGLCCKERRHATALLTSASVLWNVCFSLSQSRVPTLWRWSLEIARANSQACWCRAVPCNILSICRLRHCERSFAPTPGGSSCWSWSSALEALNRACSAVAPISRLISWLIDSMDSGR